MNHQSWGRSVKASHVVKNLMWRHEIQSAKCGSNKFMLPYGQGRSYGDSCLNDGGILLDTEKFDNFLVFDEHNGTVTCESGVTLEAILNLVAPKGWFLPVVPGTKFVSVGGAIANDIHGKNHHCVGTFGCHIIEFELLRSEGARVICSEDKNTELFSSTIGGLGLTGLITWAKLKLKKVKSEAIKVESERFYGLEEFFEISDNSDKDWEYTVAWVDCLAKGKQLGRGIFYRGVHADANEADQKAGVKKKEKMMITIPFNMPTGLLNKYTSRAFNSLYFNIHAKKQKRYFRHYTSFFFPLDGIRHWNRLYGKAGLFQYQCVIPLDRSQEFRSQELLAMILQKVSKSGQGSFLSVLKKFGDTKSPGMLSFPHEGVTFAMDFANRGPSTLELLDSLDEIVRDGGGAVYPAKDARMSKESFDVYYPQWREFEKYIDPKFSSSFWRRVTGKEHKNLM